MKNKTIFALVLILVAAFSFSITYNALGAKDTIKTKDQNFLTMAISQNTIERGESTTLIISGSSFEVGQAYCAVSAGLEDGVPDEYVISINSTTIGKCVIDGFSTFGSTTLTSTSVGPGTVVRIDALTPSNVTRSAAVTIAP